MAVFSILKSRNNFGKTFLTLAVSEICGENF